MKFHLLVCYSLMASGILFGAQVHRCGPGEVWSGEACVVHHYCPDGKPLLPGKSCAEQSSNSRPNQSSPPPRTGAVLPRIAEPPCSRRTQFFAGESNNGDNRTLLLSNGDAQKLFERYTLDARRAKIGLNLEDLQIILIEKKTGYQKLEAPRMGISDFFHFATPGKLWIKKLSGLWAQNIKNVEGEANRLRADLLCGAQ